MDFLLYVVCLCVCSFSSHWQLTSGRLNGRSVYQLIIIIPSRCFSYLFLCKFIQYTLYCRHNSTSCEEKIMNCLYFAAKTCWRKRNFSVDFDCSHTDSDEFYLYAKRQCLVCLSTCSPFPHTQHTLFQVLPQSFCSQKKVSNPHAIRLILILTALIYFDDFQENRWQNRRHVDVDCHVHTQKYVFLLFLCFCSFLFFFFSFWCCFFFSPHYFNVH